MATAAEIAQERAEAKLRRAGLNPEGIPFEEPSGAGDDDYEDFGSTEADEAFQPSREDDEKALLRSEIEAMRQQLSALQGRVAPTQQELELQRTEARVLRQRLEQAERDRQDEIERLKQELEEKRNPLDLKDLVDENDLQNFDAETLQVFAKIADKVAQRRTPKIDARAEALRALQERDEQRVQTYRERALLDPARGLHNLDALSRDPRFMQWAQSDDVDLDSTLNSLLRARTEEDVDRYAKIASRKIAQYNAQSKSQAGSNRSAPSGTDPNVRLTAGMRRGSVQRETDAQRDAKLAEARRLSRSSNLHDRNKAKAILESIS